MSGRLIDEGKALSHLQMILMLRKENYSAVLFDFEAAIKSGRLDAQSPTPGQDGQWIPDWRPITEALDLGIKWMGWWLDNQGCDCDEYGHICGRNQRGRELDKMREARKLLPPPPTRPGEEV